MKIAVVGTGYVGLVAGACLADMGNSVICVENNTEKLVALKSGIIPIYEPGLSELVQNNFKQGRITFTSDLAIAVEESKVIFICVGTPQSDDGSADLSGVYSVAENIAKSMNGYKVIVDKSTVPVGTAEKLTEYIKSKTNYPFDIVSNPEFLKQGNAVNDFLSPDRVIIGSNSDKATEIMKELYAPYLKTSNRIIFMDVKSAEMTKYAANCFLAAKISFMNEVANICEKVGADVEMVRQGMSADTRIGNKFLFSGIGFGGSCFPKDLEALIKTGIEYNCDMKIMRAVSETNRAQRLKFVDKIKSYFSKDLSGKTFAVWGLAFKPKTNDMREAPSVTIIEELLKSGAKIKAFDPKSVDTAKKIFKDRIFYADSSYDAVENADALLLLTEWNEFRKPDFEKLKSLLKTPVIFDGRNQYNKKELHESGFEYFCVGR